MSESDTELTEKQREVKEKFKEQRGYWSEMWDDFLKLDPEFLDLYRAFSAHPWNEGVLEPKVKELIYISIDVSTNHLYNRGTRYHIQNALDYGASVDEIMEMFQLTSVIGVHSATEGMPILADEVGRPGEPAEEVAAEQERLKDRFEEERGYWSESWEDVLQLDHEYFERYLEYSAHPWKEGVLDPKVKEFIYIAAVASTTTLYNPGIRVHVQQALEYGATREEIMEVFQLISVLGVHTLTESVPVLIDEAKKRGKLPDDF
jgi:AhpD family alkylhydroperoxidase